MTITRTCCKAKAKAKDLSLKAKANDLTFKAKAKDFRFKAKAKDTKIVLKESLRTRPRPRINITAQCSLKNWRISPVARNHSRNRPIINSERWLNTEKKCLKTISTQDLHRVLICEVDPVSWAYNTALDYCEMIECLKLRRYNFQNKFFKQICHPENCLYDLLPPKRGPSLSLRLRHSTVYHIPQVRTNRYCSFINYALKKYQWSLFYDCCIFWHIALYFHCIPLYYYISVSVLVL